MYTIYRVRGDVKKFIIPLYTFREGEHLIKVLRWFQELEVSGKMLYLNFSIRVGIMSRFVRVFCNLRIESGIKRLRYSGVS